MALICELDEQWSFVGSKARQHWLWYAYKYENWWRSGLYTLAYGLGLKPVVNLALFALYHRYVDH